METYSSTVLSNDEQAYCGTDAYATYEMYKRLYYEKLIERLANVVKWHFWKENNMTRAEKFNEVFGTKIDLNDADVIQDFDNRCFRWVNSNNCKVKKCDGCPYSGYIWMKEEYKEPTVKMVKQIAVLSTIADLLAYKEKLKIADKDIIDIRVKRSILFPPSFELEYFELHEFVDGKDVGKK